MNALTKIAADTSAAGVAWEGLLQARVDYEKTIARTGSTPQQHADAALAVHRAERRLRAQLVATSAAHTPFRAAMDEVARLKAEADEYNRDHYEPAEAVFFADVAGVPHQTVTYDSWNELGALDTCSTSSAEDLKQAAFHVRLLHAERRRRRILGMVKTLDDNQQGRALRRVWHAEVRRRRAIKRLERTEPWCSIEAEYQVRETAYYEAEHAAAETRVSSVAELQEKVAICQRNGWFDDGDHHKDLVADIEHLAALEAGSLA